MRKTFKLLGTRAAGVGAIYGLYGAIRLFFDVGICAGADCHWVFADWHWAAWRAVFLFVALPLSPIVSTIYGWPFYVVAAILYWPAKRGEPMVAG